LIRYLNTNDDIVPNEYLVALQSDTDVPENGIFVGYFWHSLERDLDGQRWRWMDRDAQIIVTRPSSVSRRIEIDLAPGPGIGQHEARVQIVSARGELVSEIVVVDRSRVTFDLPLQVGTNATFILQAPDGGKPTPSDPRILNLRVFSITWAESEAGVSRSPRNWNQ
jgi:hypothetical protein